MSESHLVNCRWCLDPGTEAMYGISEVPKPHVELTRFCSGHAPTEHRGWWFKTIDEAIAELLARLLTGEI